MMLPSEIVKISLPPHFVHLPTKGGLLNFSLQLTHLKTCIENFLKLPLISLMKCLSITNLATSSTSTALIFLHNAIMFLTFSSIVGNLLYEEFKTPWLKLSVSCVKDLPTNESTSFFSLVFTVFIFTSEE